MSRTEKDRPAWVRANDPTCQRVAVHRCGHTGHPCDLRTPAGPHDWGGDGCILLADERATSHPSASLVHALWWGPQRAAARAADRQLAREYNSTGRVDPDPVPGVQHRHSA